MIQFRVLYQDEFLVAIDKPAGFQVHAPEKNPSGESHRISNEINCLYLLRKQLGKYLYPVHRLDRATSGVLLFALSPETARELSRYFKDKEIKKTYFAVTRGWSPTQGLIDHPLKSEHSSTVKKEAITSFERIATVELPIPLGKHATSRYSLVMTRPLTGRMHQIRRHFAHLSHPLIGDTIYGDGKHNRLFREILGEKSLLLKAYSLDFAHPVTRERLVLTSRWNHTWHQVFDLFGVCPINEGTT